MSARSCFGGGLAVLVMLIMVASGVIIPTAGDERTAAGVSEPSAIAAAQPTRAEGCAEGSGTAFSFEFEDPEVTPNCPQYDLPLNLSSITNIDQIRSIFGLNQSEEDYLSQHGSLGLASDRFTDYNGQPYDTFECAYIDIQHRGLPVFATTDSMMHAYHVLFDTTLKDIEETYLIEMSKNMTIACLQEAERQYSVASGQFTYSYVYYTYSILYGNQSYQITETISLKEAARKNVAFFCVALRLLDPNATVPDYVSSVVESELSLIESHNGVYLSPLFDRSNVSLLLKYKEDYSQYVPRGHYTSSVALEQYFKAMMWYGRMGFRVKSGEETVQAIMVSQAMASATCGEVYAKDIWKKIYEVTAFFVGTSDDLTFEDYNLATAAIYGGLSSNLSTLIDTQKLTDYRNAILLMRLPKICSNFVSPIVEDQTNATVGLRFMGQRFVPDSYMFQELVYPNVMQYTGDGMPPSMSINDVIGAIRGTPRGFDVQGILGSEMAIDFIKSDGDDQYLDYPQQYDALQAEFTYMNLSAWSQNLYWGWLYTLKSLNENFSMDNYPTFMRDRAWQAEKLNTDLGSWSQLRHDTILYAKQSYSSNDGAGPPSGGAGYVEPIPKFYARLATLIDATKMGLTNLSVLSPYQASLLSSFGNLVSCLETLSERELANIALNPSEQEQVSLIGDTLFYMFKEVAARDKETTIVADVHTDGNTDPADGVMEKCLEVGTGYVSFVIVAVKHPDGSIDANVGPIFSYHEFRQNMSDRLTDEKWKDMLAKDTAPPAFDWMDYPEDLGSIGGPEVLCDLGLETSETMVSDLEPLIGDSVVIGTAVHNYQGPMQNISLCAYDLIDGGSLLIGTVPVQIAPNSSVNANIAWNTSTTEFGGHTIELALTNLPVMDMNKANNKVWLTFTVRHRDTDGDGVPDTCDAFPTDPSASLDTDLDGYPDAWNPGKDASDSTLGLTLDPLPEEGTQWSDRDGDGYGDNTTGSNADAFPDNPSEWKDTDGDRVGDNADAFPKDPAASVDSDHDGFPDSWNEGMSQEDSVKGLQLDHYPTDPMRWKMEDGGDAASSDGNSDDGQTVTEPMAHPEPAEVTEEQSEGGTDDDPACAPEVPGGETPAKDMGAAVWVILAMFAMVFIAMIAMIALTLAKRDKGKVRQRKRRMESIP